jgi:hypothetical protein
VLITKLDWPNTLFKESPPVGATTEVTVFEVELIVTSGEPVSTPILKLPVLLMVPPER